MSFDRYLRSFEATSLVKGGSVVPIWLDDGRSFWFDDGDGAKKVDPATGVAEPYEQPEPPAHAPKLVRKGYYGGAPDIYEVPSPDGRWFLGVKDHNLYLRSTQDGRSQQPTD